MSLLVYIVVAVIWYEDWHKIIYNKTYKNTYWNQELIKKTCLTISNKIACNPTKNFKDVL